MIPHSMNDLTNLDPGTLSYNTPMTFRYPCENCTEVLQLAGMTQNVFNTYIEDEVIHFDQNIT